MQFLKYGETRPYKNVMLTLGTCDPLPGSELYTFDKEKDLLLKFVDILKQEDPEVITGYNIQNFDTPWIMKRAQQLHIEDQFNQLSKFIDHECKLRKKFEKSSVGELVEVEVVDIPGRIHLDIFKLAQKNYKLESYGLSAVSANFIQGVIQSIQTVHCQYETLRLTDRVVVGESVPPNVHHAPFEPRYSPDGENVICFKGRLHTAPPAHRFCEAGTRARYAYDTTLTQRRLK